MENHSSTVPTASGTMYNSSRNAAKKANGDVPWMSKTVSRRQRSKSESHATHTETESFGVIVKPAKDKSQDRKRKNLKGRGLPKKGGAGGKGVWGKEGQIYEEADVDAKDPNYESDKDEGYVMEQIDPELTSEQFEYIVEPLILEYFDHGDTAEVIETLYELNITHLKHMIVNLGASLALERKGSQRELTSILISDLYGAKVLKEKDIELGFQSLLNRIEDIKLDNPNCAHILGQFMARAVADDCLNPVFLNEHNNHPLELAREALSSARTLLSIKHGIVRLDYVWGVSGGVRPVKHLVKAIILLLKEYLTSEDIREADRCVRDLDVPHFHHEIVYEAIVLVLEEGTQNAAKLMTGLLQHFSNATLISQDQLQDGFRRVFSSMEDLVLDIPHAYQLLSGFLDMCVKAGVITRRLRDGAPTRGRKRFVSEGDHFSR